MKDRRNLELGLKTTFLYSVFDIYVKMLSIFVIIVLSKTITILRNLLGFFTFVKPEDDVNVITL